MKHTNPYQKCCYLPAFFCRLNNIPLLVFFLAIVYCTHMYIELTFNKTHSVEAAEENPAESIFYTPNIAVLCPGSQMRSMSLTSNSSVWRANGEMAHHKSIVCLRTQYTSKSGF